MNTTMPAPSLKPAMRGGHPTLIDRVQGLEDSLKVLKVYLPKQFPQAFPRRKK
jgi:hypothetical protein